MATLNYTKLHYKTRAAFDADLTDNKILNDSVVFIKDTNQIYTHGQFYDANNEADEATAAALNDLSNEISQLKIRDKELTEQIGYSLTSQAAIDILSYGVQWEDGATSPICTRIGNIALHKSLPIQSQYKGCIYDPETTTFKYWLDPNDWSKKADGTASVLDGTDGQVMVHTPKFYGKSGTTGTTHWVRISLYQIDDTWQEIPELYVGAYRASVNSSTNKAASIVNYSTVWRGGTNNNAYDKFNDSTLDTYDPGATMLNKPRTFITITTARNYARNANTQILSYEQYKWIFYWAYVIEYANFNCQADFKEDLTADGLHQGGLGAGVTTWQNTPTTWGGYNARTPITPNGFGNSLGNNTGILPFTTKARNSVESKTFNVPRWRGFDNPFGDTHSFLDGIICQETSDQTYQDVYTTEDPTYYGNTEESKQQMTLRGQKVRTQAVIKEFYLGTRGEIFASSIGNNDYTLYKCDGNYSGAIDGALKLVVVGGLVNAGPSAGFGCLNSGGGVGLFSSASGFRAVAYA